MRRQLFLSKVIAMTSFVILSPSLLWACSVCFKGDANDATSISLRWAILSLLFILLVPLTALAVFFIKTGRRSRQMQLNLSMTETQLNQKRKV